ncbi:MAG: 50S ribosomal protein L16 [Candidatus Micrarchaeia archaeon]
MGLRPGRIVREIKKQAWTRYSIKKPRKSYVKSMPHNAIQITSMGNQKGYYTKRVDLVATKPVQIRDNALEASRQAANKYLEAKIPGQYHLFLRVQPHHVIREIKMVFGAGADRIQKGMKHAWGKPSDRAARVYEGTVVYTARVQDKDLPHVKEAFRRARIKLPGSYKVEVVDEVYGTAPAAE